MTAAVTIHMTPEMRERLVAAAERDRRKLGDFTRLLIEDALVAWDHRHQEPINQEHGNGHVHREGEVPADTAEHNDQEHRPPQ